MPLHLTDAQLDGIAANIYILRDPSTTMLPEPGSSTGASSLEPALSSFGIPQDYPNVGIGVVSFSRFPDPPRFWLHNPGAVWRIASTSKIAVVLAAVQLREDVRAVQRWNAQANVLQTPQDYDELFAMRKLWARAKDPQMTEIAGPDHAPRISTIFDFPADGSPAEFFGGDTTAIDESDIINRLTAASEGHLTWKGAKDFEFNERLWLMGTLSDNVAATSCASQIGAAYIKAVQRAYGLFRKMPSNMRLLMGFGEYEKIDQTAKVSNRSNERFRKLSNRETQHVLDVWNDPAKQLGPHDSWEGGTAAALLTYLTAMVLNRLAPSDVSRPDSGFTACQSIMHALSGGSLGISSLMTARLTTDTTTRRWESSKVGLLGALAADFCYVETVDRVATPGGVVEKQMVFGMVGTNLRNDGMMGQGLGKRIHDALLSIAP